MGLTTKHTASQALPDMAKASLKPPPLGPEPSPPFTKASRCRATVQGVQVRLLPGRGIIDGRSTGGGHISGHIRLVPHSTVAAFSEAIGEMLSQGGAEQVICAGC